MKKNQNIQVQHLSQNTEERFVLKNKGSLKYSTFYLLIATQQEDITSKKKQQIDNALFQNIQKFKMMKRLQKTSAVLENYAYSFDKQYFKVDQAFYFKTLYSLNPKGLQYQEKLNIIAKIANIVAILNKQKILIRSLCPQIISCTPCESDIQIKINWLDQAIQLVYDTQQVNKSMKINKQIFQYIAPEIRLKRPHGLAADVWSLGAIFFQILFGNINNIVVQTNKVQINFPPKTPKWLQNILVSALQFEPEQRCTITILISHIKSMLCCSESANKFIPHSY